VATISASYAQFSNSGVKTYGGALDVPIIRGTLVTPEIALRGSYATIAGVDVLKLKSYGLEAFISKGFGPLMPYGAIGRMRTDSRGTISPTVSLHDRSDIRHARPHREYQLDRQLLAGNHLARHRRIEPPAQLIPPGVGDLVDLLAVGLGTSRNQTVPLQAPQGRVHLPDVQRPDIPGRGLELGLQPVAVRWPGGQQRQKAVTN